MNIEGHLQQVEGHISNIREILMSEEYAKSISGGGGEVPSLKKKLGRLALVIGHTRKSKGSHSKVLGYEYDFNSKSLGPQMIKVAEAAGIACEMFFRDSGGYRQAYREVIDWGADIVIELHFNAFNETAAGSEVLLSTGRDIPGLGEKQLAEEIAYLCSKTLQTKNRGIKEKPYGSGERGWHLVNQTNQIPSLLVEPFFGDNRIEATTVANRVPELAAAIVTPCISYLEEKNG